MFFSVGNKKGAIWRLVPVVRSRRLQRDGRNEPRRKVLRP
jgi:hypothetical protein